LGAFDIHLVVASCSAQLSEVMFGFWDDLDPSLPIPCILAIVLQTPMSSLYFFWTLVSSTLQDVEPQTDHEHLHTTLGNFLSRRQVIVEDIPALFLLLEIECSTEALHLLIWTARTGLSSVLCCLLLCNLSGFHARNYSYSLLTIAVLGLYQSAEDLGSSAIICAAEFGRFLTVLLLASIIIYRDRHIQHSFFSPFALT
jgi:hypothetical protein